MASYNTRAYALNSLATTGLAIMNPRIAYELRPDLWASLQDCAIDFSRKFEAANVHRLVATFEGYGPVKVLARSADNLAKRLEWIVGQKVLELGPAEPEATPVLKHDPMRHAAEAKAAERMAYLRKLAAQEPPGHECELQREILAARKELGLESAA
ncbi:MAG: hypothetical protein RBS40_08140 [Rhodocyclaceae bacterium]|jgi:hypothetical protein|nr:hypothetical protein [Rhodocyclaceae bacterium]